MDLVFVLDDSHVNHTNEIIEKIIKIEKECRSSFLLEAHEKLEEFKIAIVVNDRTIFDFTSDAVAMKSFLQKLDGPTSSSSSSTATPPQPKKGSKNSILSSLYSIKQLSWNAASTKFMIHFGDTVVDHNSSKTPSDRFTPELVFEEIIVKKNVHYLLIKFGSSPVHEQIFAGIEQLRHPLGRQFLQCNQILIKTGQDESFNMWIPFLLKSAMEIDRLHEKCKEFTEEAIRVPRARSSMSSAGTDLLSDSDEDNSRTRAETITMEEIMIQLFEKIRNYHKYDNKECQDAYQKLCDIALKSEKRRIELFRYPGFLEVMLNGIVDESIGGANGKESFFQILAKLSTEKPIQLELSRLPALVDLALKMIKDESNSPKVKGFSMEYLGNMTMFIDKENSKNTNPTTMRNKIPSPNNQELMDVLVETISKEEIQSEIKARAYGMLSRMAAANQDRCIALFENKKLIELALKSIEEEENTSDVKENAVRLLRGLSYYLPNDRRGSLLKFPGLMDAILKSIREEPLGSLVKVEAFAALWRIADEEENRVRMFQQYPELMQLTIKCIKEEKSKPEAVEYAFGMLMNLSYAEVNVVPLVDKHPELIKATYDCIKETPTESMTIEYAYTVLFNLVSSRTNWTSIYKDQLVDVTIPIIGDYRCPSGTKERALHLLRSLALHSEYQKRMFIYPHFVESLMICIKREKLGSKARSEALRLVNNLCLRKENVDLFNEDDRVFLLTCINQEMIVNSETYLPKLKPLFEQPGSQRPKTLKTVPASQIRF